MLRVRLRLAEIMERRGFTPAHLAACSRVPTAAVLRLLQPLPPHEVRLQLLGTLAAVLGVSPGKLLEDVPQDLACTITVGVPGNAATQRPDTLRDLEDAWAREFPQHARKDPDALSRWPFLAE